MRRWRRCGGRRGQGERERQGEGKGGDEGGSVEGWKMRGWLSEVVVKFLYGEWQRKVTVGRSHLGSVVARAVVLNPRETRCDCDRAFCGQLGFFSPQRSGLTDCAKWEFVREMRIRTLRRAALDTLRVEISWSRLTVFPNSLGEITGQSAGQLRSFPHACVV